MTLEFASIFISIAAFGLSIFAYWSSSIRKRSPQFVCSRWTAVRLDTPENTPLAAFMIQVSVINRDGTPLEIRDLLLVARNRTQNTCYYEPLLLWDLRQWIEDGDRPDKVGRAQKGQVPLPLLVPAHESYDFDFPLLFLPVAENKVINAISNDDTDLSLYCLTDRSRKYVRIASQIFTSQELRNLEKGGFSAVRTSAATKMRGILMQSLSKS